MKKYRARLIISIFLIIAWFGIAGVGGPTFGKISKVSTDDPAAFLPASAESTQVQQLQRRFDAGQAIPAIMVIESAKTLDLGALSAAHDQGVALEKIAGVQGPVVGPISSSDLRALEFIVPIKSHDDIKKVVPKLRQALSANLPPTQHVYVTGPAGLTADLLKAFGGIDGILLVAALLAVLVILLVVYRSILLPILVLLNAMFALCAAILVVYYLAKQGIIKLSGQSQGILSILVIGAATDYSLLLVSRYREALAASGGKWQAIMAGIKGSFEPILASAATVCLALLCLLFSDLNSNRSLGPIAATGIVMSFLATLTFLPALLGVFGRAAFWPSHIAPAAARPAAIKTGQEELTGFWKRVGGLVAGQSRPVWIITVLVLGLASLGLLQLRASGVPQTDLVLSQSNARDGQKAIARHFDAGAAAPMLISVPQASLDQTLAILRADPDISDIFAFTGASRTPILSRAKVVDGRILLSATLKIDPYSDRADQAVSRLRAQLKAASTGAQVGGTTALAADSSTTAISDLRKIVPIVLLMILLVLALLLRALIAPLILIFTVVLSFAATLGVSALVFNHVFNFSGADATVPLFGFVFLVALGVDYNIFLITRTREEAMKFGTRAAILHSLGKTGGVITSAGIVLAATFAALGIIPILFLAQLAFIVAFGVLLDAVIVRSLLVPALFNELGSKVWWPSRRIN